MLPTAFIVFCAMALSTSFARADFVTTINFASSTNVSDSAAFDPNSNPAGPSSPASGNEYASITAFDVTSASHTVKLSLDVFSLNTPFAIQFGTSRIDPFTDTIIAGPQTETFIVTMTNKLGGFLLGNGGTPAPTDPGDTGKEIGPVGMTIPKTSDGTNNAETATFTNFNGQTATPNHYAINDKNLDFSGNSTTPGNILFGGRSGGGGSIPFNGTEVFTFQVTLPKSVNTSSFTMTFVANPEPGSLALAGLLGVTGFFGLRRRRSSPIAAEPTV